VRLMKRAKTVEVAQTRHDKRSDVLQGEVKLLVPASPEEIIAFLMQIDSKFYMSKLNPKVDVRFEVLEVKSLHHTVFFSEIKTAPLQNRTFLGALVWRKISDVPLTYVLVAAPVECHDKLSIEQDANAVRAEVRRVLRLTSTADGHTSVEYACSLDLRGHFPKWLVNEVALPQLLNVPYTLQTYFAHVKRAPQCTAKDGVLLGHLLADTVEMASPHERTSAITTFVCQTSMMRECGFVFLDAMLAAFFEAHFGLAKFKAIFAQPVATFDPAALTAAEATTIGSGFDAILRKSTDHFEAVGELLSTYAAMVVMEERYVWFRPLLETIAKRRMASAPLGLKLRLTIGAGLSVADMISDINNIINMFLAGQSAGAYALLSTILVSLSFQILLVVMQNSHRGKRVVAWEIFLVLSLFKAGVDAIRVARGDEQIAGCPVNPAYEMTIGKAIELVCESIPGSLLQAIFLLSGGWTTAATLSIMISCLSTAFTTTTIAYDMDTTVQCRRTNPEFYGCAAPPVGPCWVISVPCTFFSASADDVVVVRAAQKSIHTRVRASPSGEHAGGSLRRKALTETPYLQRTPVNCRMRRAFPSLNLERALNCGMPAISSLTRKLRSTGTCQTRQPSARSPSSFYSSTTAPKRSARRSRWRCSPK
jgi:hypothetical protein